MNDPILFSQSHYLLSSSPSTRMLNYAENCYINEMVSWKWPDNARIFLLDSFIRCIATKEIIENCICTTCVSWYIMANCNAQYFCEKMYFLLLCQRSDMLAQNIIGFELKFGKITKNACLLLLNRKNSNFDEQTIRN